ncbi:MAG: hypothetical protein BJ554DRAFT_1841, partial [Olpidium bornovanus]
AAAAAAAAAARRGPENDRATVRDSCGDEGATTDDAAGSSDRLTLNFAAGLVGKERAAVHNARTARGGPETVAATIPAQVDLQQSGSNSETRDNTCTL